MGNFLARKGFILTYTGYIQGMAPRESVTYPWDTPRYYQLGEVEIKVWGEQDENVEDPEADDLPYFSCWNAHGPDGYLGHGEDYSTLILFYTSLMDK
jgi:hypothetical protein